MRLGSQHAVPGLYGFSYGPFLDSGVVCIWYILGMYWGADKWPILRVHRKTLGIVFYPEVVESVVASLACSTQWRPGAFACGDRSAHSARVIKRMAFWSTWSPKYPKQHPTYYMLFILSIKGILSGTLEVQAVAVFPDSQFPLDKSGSALVEFDYAAEGDPVQSNHLCVEVISRLQRSRAFRLRRSNCDNRRNRMRMLGCC